MAKNIKIAICDHEQMYAERIAVYFAEAANSHHLGCDINIFLNGTRLIEKCTLEKPDAVFLDIDMPGQDGFETARQLMEVHKDVVLVFVSCKEKMVFLSYEYKPFWFVPKSQTTLLKIVIEKVIRKVENIKNENKNVSVKVENKKVIDLDLKQVAYFKTSEHYLHIVMKDGTSSESYRYKLDNIEKQLKEHWFVRVHKRYLVNCRAISTIKNGACHLTNGEEIPISRSQTANTKEIFHNYMRSIR